MQGQCSGDQMVAQAPARLGPYGRGEQAMEELKERLLGLTERITHVLMRL